MASRFVAATSQSNLDYLRGLSEERAGHPVQALDAYEKVVAQDPQALEVYRDIAALHLRMGHADAALKAAERVAELAPTDAASFLFLGNVRVAQGNLAKAAEAYERALRLDPENLRALENLGNYYSLIDPAKGVRYYQRYLEIDPGEPEIYFQLALLYQKNNDFKKAIQNFKKSIEVDPQQIASHIALAELYENQKSTEAAIGEYLKASEAEPHNPLLAMRLGRLYYSDRKFEEAMSAFERVRSMQPQDPSIHYWLARAAEERRLWADAARYAEQAYALSKDPQFLPLTAYYLTINHQSVEAIKWLEKARKADPNNANVLLFLGMNYLELNKPEKAKDVLVRGVAHHPQDAQLHFQLGVTEDRLGHMDDAAIQFKSVLAIDPKNAAAMNYLGYSWAERGVHLEEAEHLLRKAVELDPTNGAFLDSLGWILHKRGASQEARRYLEQAAQKMPDALIFDHLGDVCMQLNDSSAAVKAWNQSLSLDPKNEAVKKKVTDASSRVIKGSDSRKYLKFMEGNFRQLIDLRGLVTVDAQWKKRPIRTGGRFLYSRPDQLVVTLGAKESKEAPRVIVAKNAVRVEPAEWAKQAGPLPLDQLAAIPQFLSGALMAPLDSEDVRAETKEGAVHYSTASQEAWVEVSRGLLTRLSRVNPAGGRDELDVSSYQMIDGLWLPEKMRFRNKARGWDARLVFSDWVVNQDR